MLDYFNIRQSQYQSNVEQGKDESLELMNVEYFGDGHYGGIRDIMSPQPQDGMNFCCCQLQGNMMRRLLGGQLIHFIAEELQLIRQTVFRDGKMSKLELGKI